MKILLTGFEAYGNTPHNPAEAVARALDGKFVNDSIVISRVVPNVFFECIDYVIESISEIQPNVVVMLGEFGGRPNITVERIAQNLNDSARYELTDNQGVSLQDKPTVVGGPAAYYASLPIRAMVKTMRESGIPADISDAPGTFCCNHLMYGILHHLSSNNLPIRAGWIHLPHLPSVAAAQENIGAPSMSAETSAEGVEICIRAILENSDDIEEPLFSRLQV